jgi:hypothetical protein
VSVSRIASRFLWTILLSRPVLAQEPTTPELEQATLVSSASGTTCLEPPPMVGWQDYDGPLAKLVGTVGRKLDRRSIHLPHYKPGSALCSLGARDKFVLFVQDSIDPVTLAGDVFNAGLDHAQNATPAFGEGLQGFGKRLGADTASDVSERFFSEFLFPTLLSEDPRYYRLGRGGGAHRLWHALAHSVIAHRDSGRRMPNLSEWAGVTAGTLLSDIYQPGSTHGPGPIAWQVSSNVLQDAGFDVLREFWPEIARKFHVPFRAASQPTERPVR